MFKKIILSIASICLFADSLSAAIDFSKVADDVKFRKQLFPQAKAWNISSDKKITKEEQKCLNFLWSAMPLSDLLMYSGDYYLDNIRIALKARNEMKWGNELTDDLFYHFVLPVRANNEYIDDFRTTYYDELSSRVKGMSMEEAALEINHWCHEKVTYEPSDGRTSGPMATMLTAKGRCGEESVFGVSALRAVGIPARQVYTPRWAHTDDNHAWVEVYANGKWHFLGACEPEPTLDMAWFNAPVSRGMLMHTRVFGDYSGKEQIINRHEGITEINVVDNYVPSHTNTVIVQDENGNPLADVPVKFKIYNYSEFNTAATIKTDISGKASLLTGKGDIIVWASKNGKFGFAKMNGGEYTLKLDRNVGDRITMDMDIIPPVENPIKTNVTEAEIEKNKIRLAHEDSIRQAYMNTFFNPESMPQIDKRLSTILCNAKGNWRQVLSFVNEAPEFRKEEALAMLEAMNIKDLHDTPADILMGTLICTEMPDTVNANVDYVKYVLNPRISNEMITAFRASKGKELFPPKKQTVTVEDIISEIKSGIKLYDKYNPYHVPIVPDEVEANRIADRHSRDIYFVAKCRKNGIPAKIDEITGKTMYHDGVQWINVSFDKEIEIPVLPKGVLKCEYEALPYLSDPQYYRHYSISNMDNGNPNLLEYDENDAVWSNTLRDGTELAAGYYLLVSGSRQASGNVLAHLEFFNVEENKTSNVPLVMRHDDSQISVIGNINAEAQYLPTGTDTPTTILSTTGRGYFILAILGATDEPSNHAVLELSNLTDDLNKWGRPLLVLTEKERNELSGIKGLHYGHDIDSSILSMFRKAAESEGRTLPMIAIADSFGRMVFISEGYDTNLAQKIRKVISGI